MLVTPTTTAVAATGYFGAVAVFDPFQATIVGCPINRLTGGFCPGCGSTRAVHELLHGDVVGSLICHPMVIPLLAFGAYLWVSWVVRRRGGRPWALSPTQLPAAVPMLLAVTFVTLTVVRNVPGLEWLTPPDVAP
ncbi:DUF2752 domain-containing protein [Actinospongicola halichondriae]|uniref:DUF2752 domain-containing protein n=1 Tax=Actinospongicola halichondriae TaxID=3236844 RepID=UPI003D43CC8B